MSLCLAFWKAERWPVSKWVNKEVLRVYSSHSFIWAWSLRFLWLDEVSLDMLEIPIQVCAGISVSVPLLFLVCLKKKYVTGSSWKLVSFMPSYHVGEISCYTLTRFQVFRLNPYPTAFPYGNGMVLHFYQQQESSTTKTVHKVINKGLKTYV